MDTDAAREVPRTQAASALTHTQLATAALFVVTALALGMTARFAPDPRHALAMMLTVMFAALVSSVAGFAFSAIAGAVVYHLATPLEAVTTMMVCSIVIQVYSVAALWRSIAWRRLAPFFLGGALTVIPASWLVLHVSARAYLAVIGVLLVSYGGYMLARRPLVVEVGPSLGRTVDVITGALGGITGPLAAFPGAAITIWCGLRGWDKMRQRAIYQPYILVMQLAAMIVIASMTGRRQPFHAAQIAYAMPALFGCHVGLVLFRRISTAQFNRIVYTLLITSGVSLAFK